MRDRKAEAARSGGMGSSRRWDAVAPISTVLIVLPAELWQLRAQALPVAYGNDSSVHQQMVRFATDEIARGRSPLSGSPYAICMPRFPWCCRAGKTAVPSVVGAEPGPGTHDRI